MEKTTENKRLVAEFFVARMSINELKEYVQTDIQEEYHFDDFIFEDDAENMERLLEKGVDYKTLRA